MSQDILGMHRTGRARTGHLAKRVRILLEPIVQRVGQLARQRPLGQLVRLELKRCGVAAVHGHVQPARERHRAREDREDELRERRLVGVRLRAQCGVEVHGRGEEREPQPVELLQNVLLQAVAQRAHGCWVRGRAEVTTASA